MLTAIEDFVAERERLRLVVLPIFFGLGVLWHLDAPWSDAVAAILDPWDRNPLLQRLEENRILQIAQAYAATSPAGAPGGAAAAHRVERVRACRAPVAAAGQARDRRRGVGLSKDEIRRVLAARP